MLGLPAILWLALLPIGCAAYLFFKKRKNSGRSLLALSAPGIIVSPQTRSLRWIYRGLFSSVIAGLLLFVWVMAQPYRTERWTKKWSEGIDILIALDVSESMDATDFKPNRLVAAKKVISEFIDQREHDRIGLVAFGGEALTLSPLTRDYDFLKRQLNRIKTRELKQGTAIGMSIAASVARFQGSKTKSKVIVLLTDGDNNVGSINPITAAQLAREDGIKIYAIGIGRSQRVVVPIYAYNSRGEKLHVIAKVPSYLNPDLLKDISRRTDGKAYMATDSAALGRVLQEIDQLERTKVFIRPKQKNIPLFFPFAAAGTLLLLVAVILLETRFRRAEHVVSV